MSYLKTVSYQFTWRKYSSVVTFRNISDPLLDLADGSNSSSGSYRDLFNPTNMRHVSSFNTLCEQLAVQVIYEA